MSDEAKLPKQGLRRVDDAATEQGALSTAGALEALQGALELDPLCGSTWNALGVVHASRGELVDALNAFRRALAVEPGDPDAAKNLGRLEADFGRPPRDVEWQRGFTVVTVSPPGYIHSHALDEIAETIHFGLRRLGLDSRMTSTPDDSARTHVILGAHLLDHHEIALPPDSIIYNTEQIHSQCLWLTPQYLDLLRVHRVWDYSSANVEALRGLGVSRVRCVPIGHAEELKRISVNGVEDVDVVFAGSVSDRRAHILSALVERGLRVQALFGVYGEERDAWIARAKIVLNLRYYEEGPFEIVRVAYLLSNERFVVSERPLRVEDENALAAGIVFAPYGGLVDACVAYVDRAKERHMIAARGLELMRGRPMSEILRGVVLEK